MDESDANAISSLKLKSLQLSNIGNDDPQTWLQLFSSSRMKHLQDLQLINCNFINELVLNSITSNCPNLTSLNLEMSWFEDHYGLVSIGSLKNLKKIRLYCAYPNFDDDLASLFSALKQLTEIRICAYCPQFNEEVIEKIVENNPKLETLEIQWYKPDHGLAPLRKLAFLSTLHLCNIQNVPKSEFEKLFENCPFGFLKHLKLEKLNEDQDLAKYVCTLKANNYFVEPSCNIIGTINIGS